MSKFKIFFGTCNGLDLNRADYKLNKWLEENQSCDPGIYILSWQYQQSRLGDHSICVEYATYDETEKGERKQDDQ